MAIYMLEVNLKDKDGQWHDRWTPMHMPCYSLNEAVKKAKRRTLTSYSRVRIAKYERTEIHEVLRKENA